MGHRQKNLDWKVLSLAGGLFLTSIGFISKGFYENIQHDSEEKLIDEENYKQRQTRDFYIAGFSLLGSVALFGSLGVRYFLGLQKEYAHKETCEHHHEHGGEECNNPTHMGLH